MKNIEIFSEGHTAASLCQDGLREEEEGAMGKKGGSGGNFLKINSDFFLKNFSYKVGEKDENNVNFSDCNVLFVFRRGLHLPNPKSNPSRISRRISR